MSHVYPKIFTRSDDVPNEEYGELGYVYILGKSREGPVKVGISRNARKRIKDLECAGGMRFQLIWISAQCSNYRKRERDLHEHMTKFRHVGEWFNVPFDIAVRVARMYSYKGVSMKKRLASLAVAAARVKPISEVDLYVSQRETKS